MTTPTNGQGNISRPVQSLLPDDSPDIKLILLKSALKRHHYLNHSFTILLLFSFHARNSANTSASYVFSIQSVIFPCNREEFRKIKVTSFRSQEKDLLKYVKNRELLKVDLLLRRFELESIYAMDIPGEEERYQKICRAYERKVDLLDEFQRTGTITYERKTVGAIHDRKNDKNRIVENSLLPHSAHQLSDKEER